MEILTVKNLSFRYPMNQAPTLRNLSFSVEEGEFLTVCGATGSGKSTLLRLLKKELSPVGETEGEILLDGAPLASKSAASEIGYVMQHPEQQIVTDKVWHELAFGLENQNLPQNEIRRRVAEMASYFGMEELFFRDTVSLSGGQKQLLNLASVMVMNPKILLLDEPTAQLDPIAASDFIATLHKLHREFSLTVILIEHRLEEVMPLSDRLLILEKGELLALEPPREAVKKIENRDDLLRAMPCAVRLSHALPDHGSKYAPMTVREGKDFIREVYNNKIRSIPEQPFSKKEKALEWDRVFFRYEKNGRDVLSNLRFSVFEGECFCVLGGNGAGKSTMLGVTAGLLKPYAGTVRLFGKKLKEYVNGSLYRQNLAYLPQDVTTVFLRNTVREELEDAGTSAADFPYDFSPLLEKHPYDLSGGERQLVALAKILATQPKVLLLDEPTKGLDAHAKAEIVSVLRALKEKNVTVIAVTHDTEFSAELADRVALFFRGELISSDTPRKFFSENRFYTTPVSRMTTGYYENAVTVADAVSLCLENGRKERKT
ncbi:MAG: energy-coupling factor ABC transporter ATP-binding protein [Clostridia bacterium]|nr:energy-coupling factor ABC transporter ATP-binding protein [Clostridia bacterium]